MGTIGAPDNLAILIMPFVARIRGPRGPSGVMPTYSPAAKIFRIARNAFAPPFDEEPSVVLIPRCLTMRAMICPSRCCEISIWKFFFESQHKGIISKRPCQKLKINGVLDFQNCSGISPRTTCHRPLIRTNLMYQAVNQHKTRLRLSDVIKRLRMLTWPPFFAMALMLLYPEIEDRIDFYRSHF